MNEIYELIQRTEYAEAIKLVKNKLSTDDLNPELWYALFLCENDNYYVTDKDYNNEIAFQKAIELASYYQKSKYEAEYTLYKSFPEISNYLGIIRSIQMKDYRVLSLYFSMIDDSFFDENVVYKEKFMEALEYIILTSDVKKSAALYQIILKSLCMKTKEKIFDSLLENAILHAQNMGVEKVDLSGAKKPTDLHAILRKTLENEALDGKSTTYNIPSMERLFAKLDSNSTNKATFQVKDTIEVFYKDIFAKYISSSSYNPNLLARYFYRLYFLTKDKKLQPQVFKYCSEALKSNPDNHIYYFLGKCYGNGIGVDVNKQECIKYYTLAANANNSSAINNLAVYYFKGYGSVLQKNYTKAFELFSKAMKLGSAVGLYNVGISYMSGNGCEQNVKKGIEILTSGAEKRDLNSVDYLVRYYSSEQIDAKKKQYFSSLADSIRAEEKKYKAKPKKRF